MTTTNISAAKKTFGLALVVGICFVCLVALFNNTRSFEMQIVPKPYLFMYQEKPNSAQGPGNAKDATTGTFSDMCFTKVQEHAQPPSVLNVDSTLWLSPSERI